LPSGNPITLSAGGILNIRGTQGDDTITVAIDATNSNQLDVFYNDATTPLKTFDLTQRSVVRINFNGLKGNDSFTNSTAIASRLNGGPGNDTLIGGSGNDTIIGGSGDDSLSGGGGNDVLLGGAGNDHIDGGAGNDLIRGDSGNDTISGGDGNDTISGGDGNDSLSGDNGDDQIDGNSGNDTISGGDGNDSLSGGSGDDQVDGNNGNDTVEGGAGNDTLQGGTGDDLVDGGSGNDNVQGGLGNDTVEGGGGHDDVNGGGGQDDVIGDNNNDQGGDSDFFAVLTEASGGAVGAAEIQTETDDSGASETEVQVQIANAPANTTFDIKIDVTGDGSNVVDLGQFTTGDHGFGAFELSDATNVPALKDGVSVVEVTDVGAGGTDDLHGVVSNLQDTWLATKLAPPDGSLGLAFGAAAFNSSVGQFDLGVGGLQPNATYTVYVNGDATTGTSLGQFTTNGLGFGVLAANGVGGIQQGSAVTVVNSDGVIVLQGQFVAVNGDDDSQ
jgi:hypothetical protein